MTHLLILSNFDQFWPIWTYVDPFFLFGLYTHVDNYFLFIKKKLPIFTHFDSYLEILDLFVQFLPNLTHFDLFVKMLTDLDQNKTSNRLDPYWLIRTHFKPILNKFKQWWPVLTNMDRLDQNFCNFDPFRLLIDTFWVILIIIYPFWSI